MKNAILHCWDAVHMKSKGRCLVSSCLALEISLSEALSDVLLPLPDPYYSLTFVSHTQVFREIFLSSCFIGTFRKLQLKTWSGLMILMTKAPVLFFVSTCTSNSSIY